MEYFVPDSHSEPILSGHDNTDAEPGTPSALRKPRTCNTNEIARATIKTAARAGLPPKEIRRRYGFTTGQVYYALRNAIKPKTYANGNKPAIPQDKAKYLVSWIYNEPYSRRISYKLIPYKAAELGLQSQGEKSLRTAVESQGVAQRVSRRKGFSNRVVHRKHRLQFALSAREWERQRQNSQTFSDEVWANWGANNRNFVTVQVDGNPSDIISDRYRPECLSRKTAGVVAWMFYDIIYGGRRAFRTFWE